MKKNRFYLLYFFLLIQLKNFQLFTMQQKSSDEIFESLVCRNLSADDKAKWQKFIGVFPPYIKKFIFKQKLNDVFIEACIKGNLELVKFAIKFGCDVNTIRLFPIPNKISSIYPPGIAQDNFRGIELALIYGHTAIAKLLLTNKNLEIGSKLIHNLILQSMHLDNSEFLDALSYLELPSLPHGHELIGFACLKQNVQYIKKLTIQFKLNPNYPFQNANSSANITPLAVAISFEALESVQALVEGGADVNFIAYQNDREILNPIDFVFKLIEEAKRFNNNDREEIIDELLKIAKYLSSKGALPFEFFENERRLRAQIKNSLPNMNKQIQELILSYAK